MKGKELVNSARGETIQVEPDRTERMIVFDTLFSKDSESLIPSFMVVISFLLPLIFSVTSSFSGVGGGVKLVLQSLFSVWFIYLTYGLVFAIYNPLSAGWVLTLASIMFFIAVNLEWLQFKNITRNKSTPAAGRS